MLRAEKVYHDKLVRAKLNKPITDAVNELHLLVGSLHSSHDEIHAYHAPSECMDLVVRGVSRAAREVVQRYGFLNPQIFLDVLSLRTTPRWVHSSGIGFLFND